MKTMRFLMATAGAALCMSAFAQNVPPTAELKLAKPTAKAGALTTATIALKFAPGMHGYQNPPTDKFQIPVSITAGPGTTIKSVKYPKGVMRKAGGDTTESAVYENEVAIVVTFVAPKKVGDAAVNLVVNYQQCTQENCYPPDKVNVSAKLKVVK